MQNIYNINSIISVEIMSILICFILLYANLFEHREKSGRNLPFSFAVSACIIALTADSLSWIMDGYENFTGLLYLCTVISLIMTFVIDAIFIWYITEYTKDYRPSLHILPNVFIIITLIIAGIIVLTAGTGSIFYFENGNYHEGPYYPLYLIVNLICSVFCLFIIIMNTKYLSTHDRIAMALYNIIPWIEGFINLFKQSFSYAYPSIVLSLVVLYVMIQSERQERLKEEGMLSKYYAHHDALTGLQNRLAYEEKLKEISYSDQNIGVFFTDVNGLKYTNDNYGHGAGDKLLIRYSEILEKMFNDSNIFRISGDEFTIIVNDVNEDTLRQRYSKLTEILKTSGNSIACVGFAYGNSKHIHELINKAENEMYIEKIKFHNEHPEMERHYENTEEI